MRFAFLIVVSYATFFCNIHARNFFRFPFVRASIDENARKLESMLKLRSGIDGELFVWCYSGVIRNPLTGGEVIGVEGLEMTRAVDTSDLEGYKSSLTSSNDTMNSITYQKSFLSRKVFIFTDGKNRTEPIKTHRIRPLSPKRTISSPIKILHELITFGTHSSGKLYAKVELPGGRIIRSGDMSVTGALAHPHFLDWLPLRRLQLDLTCFLVASRKKTIGKWISFAPSSDTLGRSQEYYRYAQDGFLDKPSISCRRFGECPAWFAPGKSCCTELLAKRYRSLTDVPKENLKLFRQYCPEFFVVPLSLKTFHNQSDLLDKYKPWYQQLLQASILRK